MRLSELYRVVVCALLLIVVLLTTLFYTAINTQEVYTFPYYDQGTDDLSLNPKKPYSIPIGYFLKAVCDKSMMAVLVLVLIIRPDIKRWKISPAYPWLIFFIVWSIDYALFFESLNWRGYVDVFLSIITISYTAYCAHLTFIKN